jgi:hypothetical protein
MLMERSPDFGKGIYAAVAMGHKRHICQRHLFSLRIKGHLSEVETGTTCEICDAYSMAADLTDGEINDLYSSWKAQKIDNN